MADTLVDPVEALPATQRDPALQTSAEDPAPKPPGSKRFLLVLIGLFFLGAATAFALWRFVFAYEATALAHVPAGTNVVIRAEAADIVLFGPVRNHLLPLVLEDTAKGKPAAKPSVAERLHDRSGVRLPTDVREVLLATMDGRHWVTIFGGKFARGKFVSALAEVAREDAWPDFRLEGEVLVGPSMAIAQADDGTIIVGTDLAIVNTALPATDEGSKLGLPKRGAVTFVVARPAWETVSGAGSVVPQAAALGGVFRGTGSFTLGQSPEVVIRLEPTKGADLSAIELGAKDLLSSLQLLLLLGPDRVGEKEALRQAVISRDSSHVVVRAPWPYEGLDRGAAQLAAYLRGREATDGALGPKGP